jgi:hypothetical protein
MINPFDIQQHPPELINVSAGLNASKEVQESLLKSVDTGNAMVKTFVGSALSVGRNINQFRRVLLNVERVNHFLLQMAD